MSGYPLLPVVDLAFANADLCKWRWLRRRLPAAGSSGTAGGGSGSSSSKKDARSLPDAAWEETGCLSVCYTPSSEDIGCVLRVECTPAAAGNGGQTDTTIADIDTALSSSAAAAAAAAGQQPVYGEASTADTGPVQPGPEQPAARIRQLNPGTPLAEPWRFRVMSYNILADQYAGTSYAQQVTVFAVRCGQDCAVLDFCGHVLVQGAGSRRVMLYYVIVFALPCFEAFKCCATARG